MAKREPGTSRRRNARRRIDRSMILIRLPGLLVRFLGGEFLGSAASTAFHRARELNLVTADLALVGELKGLILEGAGYVEGDVVPVHFAVTDFSRAATARVHCAGQLRSVLLE